MAELALHGGPRVRTGAWPKTGKRFGKEELKELKEALDQNTLFYLFGQQFFVFLEPLNQCNVAACQDLYGQYSRIARA